MPHARTTIRDAVVSLLTGLSTTGENVYPSRVFRLDRNDLPCLTIHTREDVVTHSNVIGIGNSRSQERALSLKVVAHEDGDVETAEDTIDQICLEVEQAMVADKTLGGLIKELELTRTDNQIDANGEKPVVEATLSYTLMYQVKETAPDTLI